MLKIIRYTGFLFFISLFFCCQTNNYSQKEIATFIDKWHQAAAKADLETYFKMMSEDAIYIGTDASERWTKKEFYDFCKPYFEKGKTWNFKSFERNISFSKNRKIIWFDELLNTWMGVCRASGVLQITNNNLQITHYHLSVTLRNDKMKEFIQLNQD